jgi:hypothetical protein
MDLIHDTVDGLRYGVIWTLHLGSLLKESSFVIATLLTGMCLDACYMEYPSLLDQLR